MIHYDYKMTNIAKALKVTRLTVAAWKDKDEIPFTKQCVLEIITEGKLKADKDNRD
jgi:hypothetical protein